MIAIVTKKLISSTADFASPTNFKSESILSFSKSFCANTYRKARSSNDYQAFLFSINTLILSNTRTNENWNTLWGKPPEKQGKINFQVVGFCKKILKESCDVQISENKEVLLEK